MEQSTIIIIVCIIVLFYLLSVFYSRHIENSLLKGFWKADAHFCTTAGLKTFLIHMGDDHNGYIIVENEDGLIINNPVIFHLSGISINPIMNECREYKLTINWLGEKGYPTFFPTKQSLHYYPRDGKIVLSDPKQVYAILYRDNSISDLANKMPDAAASVKKNDGEESKPSNKEEDYDCMEDL